MSTARQTSAIDHLSADAIQRLINRYYAGDDIPELLKEFGIACRPGSLWRQFPPLPTGQSCPDCGAKMLELRTGRTRSSWPRLPIIQCSACGHRESPACTCRHCNSKRAAAAFKASEARQQAIHVYCTQHWNYSAHETPPEQLGASAALALLSLVRAGGWLDEQVIGPLADAQPRFAPIGGDFAQWLLAKAMNQRLVAPSPDSPIEAFSASMGAIGWKHDIVQWRLLAPNPAGFVRQLEFLVTRDRWPDGWSSELLSIWHALSAAECWEFCAFSMRERNLPMPGNTALRALLDNLLWDHSVSQVFQLLWSSGADALDFLARKQVSRPHAANYMIGACQRRADRARAEGWVIKGFQRNRLLTRTQTSYLLHDMFLGHGEHGFTGVIPRG